MTQPSTEGQEARLREWIDWHCDREEYAVAEALEDVLRLFGDPRQPERSAEEPESTGRRDNCTLSPPQASEPSVPTADGEVGVSPTVSNATPEQGPARDRDRAEADPQVSEQARVDPYICQRCGRYYGYLDLMGQPECDCGSRSFYPAPDDPQAEEEQTDAS